MGLAAQMLRDTYGRRVTGFDPRRDLPRLIGWYDFSELSGPDGSPVLRHRDKSGRGQDLTQAVTASRPTIKAAGQGGLSTLNLGPAGYLTAPNFAFQNPLLPTGYAQPVTYIVVAKSPSSTAGSNRVLLGTASGSQVNLLLNTYDSPQIAAGSNGATGGPSYSDGAFHVFVGCFDISNGAVFGDGYLLNATLTQAHGSNSVQQLGVGALFAGTSPFKGEIAEVLVCGDRLSYEQIQRVTSYLNGKWSLGLGVPAQAGVAYQDLTDAAGVNCRVWLPQTLKAATPWVLVSHQSGGTEQIGGGYNLYPVVHALVNAGYAVAATRQHGDSWGNDSALADLVNLYTLANGIQPAAGVILAGFSMGGLPSALAAAFGTFPAGTVKGVLTVDGVLSLANMHDNATYTAQVRAAYGVAADDSDYSSKTSGHDPVLRSGNDFTSVPRWRFYASSGDATVPPASHVDPFRALLAAAATPPVEYAKVAHLSGHLAGQSAVPADVVAFAQRCVSP